MGNESSPDRQSPKHDRRQGGTGKPPPGTVIDRRLGIDRRDLQDPRNGEADRVNQMQSTPTEEGYTGLERRRGRGRRLSEFTKSAEEGEMNTEQFLFLMAIDAFKKSNDRMFPTWTDVLEVIRLLGYRKTMPSELNLPAAEDWLERSDSDANVRPDRWAERFTETGSKAGGTEGPRKLSPKSEEELTDEALEAFEAAFGEGDEFETDLDSDLDSGLNEAA
ncbi:MAG: hypothetical protein CMJ35_03425 [Phycisphaerae bacterium]|nr:hypothetical protein [Phycisphaerae bacterium]MBM90649.1 hypothetical protein [Phycisphaerae bacterium]